MSNCPAKCATCGAGLAEGETHQHCSGCGVRLRRGGVVHGRDCPRVLAALRPGQSCSVCRRLLAAGASCPVHGLPVVG